MSLGQAVKVEAHRLGFKLAGITMPDPPPHAAVFERWLEDGREGEMAYLATDRSRQRRGDPRQILPECLSILVLGVRYWAPQASKWDVILDPRKDNQKDFILSDSEGSPTLAGDSDASLTGRVAAYAWGEDYHEVLAGRLQALVAFIERQAGRPVPHRWYTDTGPVLERDLAQRAGLGWTGKNTCLIHPQKGSYFLLAEILLGIELEPNPPFETDHCGSCTRCLEACPTGCILPDRTLDARRCLSYLTIELKGPLPMELRTQAGEWVFGCDICQQVCPWNVRFAPLEGDPSFAPRPGVPKPDLSAELALTPLDFNRKFKDSPVKRAKRRGYLRNVAVALGNRLAGGTENPVAIEALSRSLSSDPEPLVRGHVAWALGQAGGETARRTLLAALEEEHDPYVREEIQAGLESLTQKF
jgi:epoxyqueuosine reductase